MANRTKYFQMRLSEKEYETLHANANKAGLSLSTYTRFMINGIRPKEHPPKDWWAVHRKLCDIGNDLWQLKHLAFQTRTFDAERVIKLDEDFSEAYMTLFTEMISPEKMDKIAILKAAKRETDSAGSEQE